MTEIHFLTFGDGSFDYRAAANRIAREAAEEELFTSINVYNFRTLKKDFPDFWHKYGLFILNNKRGAGYWIWKPFLILQQLKKINEGDVVLYADAGCEFRAGRTSQLKGLIDTDFDIAACELNPCDGRGWLDYNIGTWTNNYTLEEMGCPDSILGMPQFASGLIFARNTTASRSFMGDWLQFATKDQYACSIDRNAENERNSFKEHRHDQSIFSILAHSYCAKNELKLKIIDGALLESDAGFFIYAARNKSGLTQNYKSLKPYIYSYKLYKKLHYFLGLEHLYRRSFASRGRVAFFDKMRVITGFHSLS